MRLPEILRRAFRGPLARRRGWRGNLDGEIGGALVGWAQRPETQPETQPGQQTVMVGLYAGGALIAQAPACVYRGDLAAGGIGTGAHAGRAGFVLPLSPELRDMVLANGGTGELRVMGARRGFLGRWHPAPTGRAPGAVTPLPPGASALQRRLYGDLQRLALRLAGPLPGPRPPLPCPPVQARLFAPQNPLDNSPRPALLPAPLFAYAEFLRLRDRLETRFDPAANPADLRPFLRHYLDDYATLRGGMRIPLSKQAIDWLNAPDEGGAPSRVIGAFQDEAPAGTHGADLAYWWAAHRAPALHCEDCLVAPELVAQLAELPGDQADLPWPLSTFMRRFAADLPELAALPLASEAGRRDLTCAMMVLALSRPDLLRYIPAASRAAALDEGHLARFCAAQGQPLPGLTPEGYAGALRLQGFEPGTLCFTALTAEGHRAEFARHAAPEGAPQVDVQMIGPFTRASGLGQATRLSADMLEQAGYSVHRVDFDLDNPSPDDARRAAATACRRARVNLWHLNAETLPLAAAYFRDLFSGSYNIAYPFWELDSPGACHFLGLEMVEELWVSTRFGVESFAPWTRKPVTAVGMSYEELPEIPRGPARALLEAKTGASPGEFIFLVTFDSYSFLGRKNPLGAAQAFVRAFPQDARGGPPVRLLLKTQNRSRVADPAQAGLWQALDQLIAGDPRITLMDATLPYREVLQLVRGADAYVSLHRSEGWGFGLIEAMNLHVPVLATGYSGNMDFCDDATCWLVDYSLTDLGPRDYIFVRPGQRWAEPDLDHAARQMRALYDNRAERETRARAALDRVRRDFSQSAVAARYAARMRIILDQLDRTGG